MGATVALALVMAACGDDAPVATTGDTTSPVAVELEDALTAVGTRYAFTADVTLDGVLVTQVKGTVYDGTGSYLVTAGGSDVEYVVSDEGQWAREPGADWVMLSDAAPLVDPLAPLASPLATVVLSATGDDALIEAVYDGAALGFSAGGDVTVAVTIIDGAVASISYDALVGDDIATVVTTFDGTFDVAPIQVPPN